MSVSVHQRITNSHIKPKANFYEGGRVTQANRDFYNATSDFESTAKFDRDTLRARARWIFANNPIMANIDETLTSNIIGSGIRFQFKTDNDLLNKEIELKWKFAKDNLDITGRDSFDYMCSVIFQNRLVDGELPIYMPYIKEFGVPCLKLQPIEVDRFALGFIETKNGMFFDGIETDNVGRVIRYHFENNTFQTARIVKKQLDTAIGLPANAVLYYYKRENRFSQYRGISEYKQTIIDLKNFSAQMRATIESARSRANISYVVQKEHIPERGSFSKNESNDPIELINGIFVKYLKVGEKIEKLDPDMAGDNFKDFVSAVIRLIATGRKVSYELAFRDYSEVNYSSARMSLLQDYKLFDREFRHFCDYVYKPIFLRWLELEAMKGTFKHLSYEQYIKEYQILKQSIRLYAPKREWVDPLKESKAIEIELNSMTTNLEAVYSKRGEDWEDELRQIAKEQAFMKALGLERRDTHTPLSNQEFDDEKPAKKKEKDE